MKIKTSELQGAALDWAVAKAEMELSENGGQVHLTERGVRWYEDTLNILYSPSTDWAQGGPIVERERIELRGDGDESWIAYDNLNPAQKGTTPLIAAMRCYVASKLGDEVEIPINDLRVSKLHKEEV
jgi:hypothetical protein